MSQLVVPLALARLFCCVGVVQSDKSASGAFGKGYTSGLSQVYRKPVACVEGAATTYPTPRTSIPGSNATLSGTLPEKKKCSPRLVVAVGVSGGMVMPNACSLPSEDKSSMSTANVPRPRMIATLASGNARNQDSTISLEGCLSLNSSHPTSGRLSLDTGITCKPCSR